MSGVAINGFGVLSAAGDSPEAFAAAVGGAPPVATDVTAMYPEPLPEPRAYTIADFNVRAELGRKGTSFFDRRTALTVSVCRRALADAGLSIDDSTRRRIGVVLGTTVGSARSSVDYAVETFTQHPPYMVNPALFPNTVMNCAAGQSAIWFGLNGINATVAGGPLAFLTVLRYCVNAFRGGQADHVLAGAVEEFTPHSAWMGRAAAPAARTLPGEGGAVFVLAPRDAPGRDGEVLSVALGFSPDGHRVSAMAACLRRALRQAGIDATEVATVAAGSGGDALADRAHWRAVTDVLGAPTMSNVERVRTADAVGDCQSATGALELAAILAAHRVEPGRDGQIAVLTGYTREGGVGAAVVRGWSRGADRG